MALIAEDKANKVIAQVLGLSERTVKLIARVMEKMQVRSIAQLVRQVLLISE